MHRLPVSDAVELGEALLQRLPLGLPLPLWDPLADKVSVALRHCDAEDVGDAMRLPDAPFELLPERERVTVEELLCDTLRVTEGDAVLLELAHALGVSDRVVLGLAERE